MFLFFVCFALFFCFVCLFVCFVLCLMSFHLAEIVHVLLVVHGMKLYTCYRLSMESFFGELLSPNGLFECSLFSFVDPCPVCVHDERWLLV